MKQLTDTQKSNLRLGLSIIVSFFLILGILILVHGCGGAAVAQPGPTVAEQRQTRREAKCAEMAEDVDDLRQWCSGPGATPAETHRRVSVCLTVAEYDRLCGRRPQQ